MAGAGQFDRSFFHGLFASFDLRHDLFHEIGRNHPMAAYRSKLKDLFVTLILGTPYLIPAIDVPFK